MNQKKIYYVSNFNWTLTNFQISVILFSLSAIIQMIYFYSLPLSYTIDSYQYIYNNSSVRPSGYDWFLKLLGINLFQNPVLVISTQMLLISIIPTLVFLTVVESGKIYAFIASSLSLFYGYMYTMSVQVMSETLFMFGCVITIYLISLYYSQQKIYWLVLTLISLILTSEIRQSAVPLFGGIFLIIILMLLRFKKIKYLIHSFLVLIVFLSYSSSRYLFNDKSGFDLMPFFAVHWMPYVDTSKWEISGDKEEFSPRLIDKKNGKVSKEFIDHLKNLFNNDKNFYVNMSSIRTPAGGVGEQRSRFKVYNKDNINKLVDDIIYNRTQAAHRWPQLINHLWKVDGVEKTSRFLHGAILEGIIQNPSFFKSFFIPLFIKNLLSGQALHDNVYWWYIPTKNISIKDISNVLSQFPLSASAYASWLYSLEDKTGEDPIAKIGEGGVNAYTPKFDQGISLNRISKMSEKNPFESYKKLDNITAPVIYVASFFTRVLAIFYLLAFPFLTVFSFFCRQREIVIPILGSVALIIAISFLGVLTPRQIFIHIPLLFAVFGMGLAGLSETIFKLIKLRKSINF